MFDAFICYLSTLFFDKTMDINRKEQNANVHTFVTEITQTT